LKRSDLYGSSGNIETTGARNGAGFFLWPWMAGTPEMKEHFSGACLNGSTP